MDSTVIYIVAGLSSLLCCAGVFLIFCLILGFFLLRKKGKKDATAREAISAGVVQVSQAFSRSKMREQALAEDEDDHRR